MKNLFAYEKSRGSNEILICQRPVTMTRGDRKAWPFWYHALACIKGEIGILSMADAFRTCVEVASLSTGGRTHCAAAPYSNNVNNTIKITQSHSIWMSSSPDRLDRLPWSVPWYSTIFYDYYINCRWDWRVLTSPGNGRRYQYWLSKFQAEKGRTSGLRYCLLMPKIIEVLDWYGQINWTVTLSPAVS